MSKNSTPKFWDSIFQKEHLTNDRLSNKFVNKECQDPQKETINNILTYARSVKGIKTKSGDNILISLN